MTEELIIGLAGIVIVGISAQWIAWRFKIPSILLLLFLGFMAGPITGIINTDEIFGVLLFPVVSLSVAIILFEGGLSLKLSELRATGIVAQRLMTFGMVTSWLLTSWAAYYILGFDKPLAMLLGAILVVTGPTVIIPLLRHIKTTERVASVLRWEGILIDPIGAVLTLLVYQVMLAGTVHKVPTLALIFIGKTLLVGGAMGAVGAIAMIFLLKRYWIPDFLQNPVALMMVIAVFTVSDLLLDESGLLAVTIMGGVLANQKVVTVKHITQFKEDIGVLLISSLFIILAARLRVADLAQVNIWTILFLIFLVVIARPVAVFVSTIFSELRWKERMFISLMAPRGIVAAAIASVFALRLMERGYDRAGEILPVTFLVIIGTVTFYGIGGPYFARRLGVAQQNPQGVLIFGAHSWAVRIAKMLTESGFKAVLIDTNRSNIYSARMEGLPTYYGSGLTEASITTIEMEGVGRLLAMTQNNPVNSLSVLHFNEVFDRAELYQLPTKEEEQKQGRERVSIHLRGRYLFGHEVTYDYLDKRFKSGALLKKTKLTEEFGFESFLERYGSDTAPLFLITESDELIIFTAENPPTPKAGYILIALVSPVEAPPA